MRFFFAGVDEKYKRVVDSSLLSAKTYRRVSLGLIAL
jgi:hypothetical protein